MAVTLFASGTQAATVTTEHFLSSPAVAGKFVLYIDLVNMVAGDVVELRVYKMVLTGGTQRVVSFAQFAGPQPTDALIAISEAMANTLTDANAVRFSLKQTFGTSRNFPWAVLNEEDFTTVASVNVTQISGDSTAADNAEAFFDGTGYAGTNNVIPTVTTVNGLAANVITATAIAADAITAAKIADGAIDAATFAANAINAAKLDPDVTTELQAGLATVAALATVDSIVDDILARLSPIVTKTGAVVSDGGNSATSFVTDLTESTNDYWKDSFLRLTSGALINQVKRIVGYNGTTKAVTVYGTGFTGTPAAGVTFEVVND